ncbi:MAG TPA: lysylphosphatidylglycerol synthase transmembrane domain-containing protein, partial [Steroidobacteraceae bacterium]
MKKSLQFALSALVLAALLVFFVDVEETWHTLQQLDPRWAVAGLFLMTVDRLLMTYKWLLLLGIRGYSMPLLDATALYCRAMIWGLALPSTVGADAIRTLLATRRGVRASDAVSSIVVERAIGFLTALALAIFSLAVLDYYWPEVDRYGLLPLCVLALSAGLLLLVFSFNHRAFTLLERMVP